MKAATRDIEFPRGNDYQHQLTIVDPSTPPVPVDVSGATFVAQIRRYVTPPAATTDATFSVDMTNAAVGVVMLSLSDTVTGALGGTYAWSVKMTTGANTRTILVGTAKSVETATS